MCHFLSQELNKFYSPLFIGWKWSLHTHKCLNLVHSLVGFSKTQGMGSLLHCHLKPFHFRLLSTGWCLLMQENRGGIEPWLKKRSFMKMGFGQGWFFILIVFFENYFWFLRPFSWFWGSLDPLVKFSKSFDFSKFLWDDFGETIGWRSHPSHREPLQKLARCEDEWKLFNDPNSQIWTQGQKRKIIWGKISLLWFGPWKNYMLEHGPYGISGIF